jgi:two-component system, chemotaxis family, protein-glutamate methylesterase/glutaminase
MAGVRRNIIVIGTSAGGLEALDGLVAQLSPDLDASIFIVQHMPAEMTAEVLLVRLRRHGAFQCKVAVDGERFRRRWIYIAPPDNHLLLKKTNLLVTKGARENRARPGIDPLFRSAAVAHGGRVIGVILTGMLDDGTAGLLAIKKCGGLAVVQDPRDAAYPSMPQSALRNVEVDHCVPLSQMGGLLTRLAGEPVAGTSAIPREVQIEAQIAERVVSDVAQVNGLGQQVPYNCPNCNGVLWEMHEGSLRRFRCHTGHSFSVAALLGSQSEKIEETLWMSLRMFEERKNLLNSTQSRSAAQRAQETQVHIDRLKAMLLEPQNWESTVEDLATNATEAPAKRSFPPARQRRTTGARSSKAKVNGVPKAQGRRRKR